MKKIIYLKIYILIATIILISCGDENETTPKEIVGQLQLTLVGDKDITNELVDVEIVNSDGIIVKSITGVLAPIVQTFELSEGSYRVSISSQNQEFSNTGDLVFSGISDLFNVDSPDVLSISVPLVFDLPLGQVKIVLTGVGIENEMFSLVALDTDSTAVVTTENLLEIPEYQSIENGTYRYAIQSTLRNYNTVEDFVFSGYSEEFSIAKGDTLDLNINISEEDRLSWILVPNVPISKRVGESSFIIENNIYIGFGLAPGNTNEVFKDWWVYSIDDNIWRQLDDFPGEKRFNSISFSIGSKGYICLGLDSNNSGLVELWEFDSESETWTQLPDFPGSVRSGATEFIIDKKAYLGSGIFAGQVTLTDFYVFDQETGEWSIVPDFNGDPTSGFASFSIDKVGHLVAGVINDDQRTDRHFVFDTQTEMWDELPAFPGTPRLEGLGFTIDGKGFFGLGSISNTTPGLDLWCYDPIEGIWKEKDPFVGEPRFTFLHGSNGVLGYYGFGFRASTNYNDLYLYYPTD